MIPKAVRDELGIEPGDRVDVERKQDMVVIRRHEDSAGERRSRVASLRGMLKDGQGGGTKELEAARRAEREREERKGQGRP